MTRLETHNPLPEDVERALALLIASTKRKKRFAPLTKIAEALRVARQHFGSIANVADAIGLSGKMLGQFSRADDLAEEARFYVESRAIDSVDAVVHLAQLPKDAQGEAARAVAEKELDTKDLRAVLEYFRAQPNANVVDAIKRVCDSKTRRQYIAEFVVRGGRTENQLRQQFEKIAASENIVGVQVSGSTGRVVFNRAGLDEMKRRARALGLEIKELTAMAAAGALK